MEEGQCRRLSSHVEPPAIGGTAGSIAGRHGRVHPMVVAVPIMGSGTHEDQ